MEQVCSTEDFGMMDGAFDRVVLWLCRVLSLLFRHCPLVGLFGRSTHICRVYRTCGISGISELRKGGIVEVETRSQK
jgi:hypothetical protein